MGTTLTGGYANDNGMAYDLVVAVEGYEKLLTTGIPAAAVTAWSGTDWSAALPGLQVQFDAEQSLDPWKATISVSGLSFGVMDTDNSDEFGKLAFGTHAGVSTFLDEDLDASETIITVLSTAAFAASGSIHIGTEHIAYTGTGGAGTTFTGCTRGKYAPFPVNSGTRFGRAHGLPTVGDGVVTRPKVSSLQRTWKGRWVGVWLHRKSGTVLDTKAQAQLIWAGKIVGKRDEANGMTWLECEDAKAAIRGCTLLSDQYTAKISEGIVLVAGTTFIARDSRAGVAAEANPLVVVSGGASGANEIDEGLTSIDQLAEALNQWFTSEKAAGRLSLWWTWAPRATYDGEARSRFTFSDGSTIDTNSVELSMTGAIAKFMGLGGGGNFGTFGTSLNFDEELFLEYFSPEKPFRTVVAPNSRFEVEDTRGTLWDNKLFFPSDFGIAGDDPLECFCVRLDDGAIWICKALSATVFERVAITTLESTGFTIGGITPYGGVRIDEGGDFRIKQVAVIRRGFRQLMNRLLASTGTADYNVATFDVFPSQLGAAIPWSLLGDAWEESLIALDQSTADLLVVLDKPTRLLDVIGCELAARFAQIVWKNGGLRVATWGTPTAAMAEHAFTENNKAAPVDSRDNQRTVTNETDKHLVNVVKVKYGRKSIDGEYAFSITITDKSSISDHGEREPVEIEMRNSYAFMQNTTDAIVDLTDGIANMMAIFARPLHMLKRTVDLSLFENVAPGDYGHVSDDHARNPTTGLRGLAAKPCLIVGHRYHLGGYEIDTGSTGSMGGEVDLLLMPFDNIAPYCPAADIASYVAGTKVVTCEAHSYSESSEAADATQFPIGSSIRWIEIDPDSPATTGGTDVDTVAAQSGNTITLTTGITGYSASLKYRIVPTDFLSADDVHTVDVFQADDATGYFDTAYPPYQYGMDISGAGTYTECDGIEQVALYSEYAYGNGIPLDTGYERDIARLCNNMQNWRTQQVMHSMSRSVKSNPVACVRTILEIIPVFAGPGDLVSGERYLQVQSWMRSGTGGSVTVTATLCRTPPTGTSMITLDATAPTYALGAPNVSTSWTTTSTTWGPSATIEYLSLRVADSEGVAYLVIEGTEDAETRGMYQMQATRYIP